MTSSNIQKIVQNNFHLNPWVLSKNTNEIVNTCIQKIYKQMPHNFRKDLRPPKIAAPRPENKAPIRTLKSLQREQQPSKIEPQTSTVPAKKASRSKAANQAKLNQDRLMNMLKASNEHNLQINKKKSAIIGLSNKKLAKSPNLKIYSSRRFGSSASSSRSSLFRRHDEKRRQRQPYQSQINYLVRSFHTGRFDETFAKYLMPMRNQQVKGNLGSLPDAMKVSSSIQNDLMIIDAALRNRISVGGGGEPKPVQGKPLDEPLELDRLQVWKHPPPLDKFRTNTLSELLGKTSHGANFRKQSKLSPEHRDFGRYQAGPIMQFKQPSPPHELFTAAHDRPNTELQEKHRRNRMKKLGLIQDSPTSTASLMKDSTQTKLGDYAKNTACEIRGKSNTEAPKERLEAKDSSDCCYKKFSPLSTQLEACRKSNNLSKNQRRISHFPRIKTKNVPLAKEEEESALTGIVTSSTHQSKIKASGHTKLSRPPSDLIMSPSTSQSSNLRERRNGPLALATANLSASIATNSCGYGGYRYNRSNYFPIRKY